MYVCVAHDRHSYRNHRRKTKRMEDALGCEGDVGVQCGWVFEYKSGRCGVNVLMDPLDLLLDDQLRRVE